MKASREAERLRLDDLWNWAPNVERLEQIHANVELGGDGSYEAPAPMANFFSRVTCAPTQCIMAGIISA
jgi:hypothetical protein